MRDKVVLVCGGRDYWDAKVITATLERHKEDIKTLIHGNARGADSIADNWARSRGVKIIPFPAKWKERGRAAGSIRNTQMLEEGKPDLVIAFPGGRGTENMVNQAIAAGIPVKDYR